MAAGVIAKRSKVGVAHATVLRLTAALKASNTAGGKERRPTRAFTSCTADGSWKGASVWPGVGHINRDAAEFHAARGNTSRGALFPPPFPLCAPLSRSMLQRRKKCRVRSLSASYSTVPGCSPSKARFPQ